MGILLVQAIDRYIASVEGAGYSAHTVKAYSTRLNDFCSYASRDGIGPASDIEDENESSVDVGDINTELIQAYLAALRRRPLGRKIGVSASTIAHAYAILSGFFNYSERVLRVELNPMRDVMKPRSETSVDDEFRSLTLDQLEQLLNVAKNGWEARVGPPDLRSANRKLEDFLIVALMGLAGMRVSEVCSLDDTDIVEDVVSIVGKGRKRRSIPLAPEIIAALGEYISPNARHLFGRPSEPERRIAPYSIEQRIPRLARRAGIIELRVTPHTLRHTFGSLMLSADPNALIPTRDLMGHESIETTNKYAHTREEARRLALLSLSDLRRNHRG